MTPEQRRLRAAIAAHSRWAKTVDRTKATQPATDGLLARFEREVDPDGVMAPAERRTRAIQLRRAHMSRLALASSKSRAKKATAGKGRAA